MTLTRNIVDIAAAPATIYTLAADTARWPLILPHYRYVHVIREDGPVRTVAMGAWRDAVPIQWIAEQTNDAATPHIAFKHVRGWTRGMDVEWRFAALGERATRVTIEHRLDFAFPVAREWLGRYLVSDYFIHGVAAQTLARIKAIAEAPAR